MTLHCELIWDDDIAVAGTAIATTDCVGHDGEVDAIDGVLPVLRDIQLLNYGVAGVATDLASDVAMVRLWPTNFAACQAIQHFTDGGFPYSVHTEAQSPIVPNSFGNPGGANFMQMKGRYNWGLPEGTNWVSGASYLYAAEANDDIYCTLAYSYGTPYPYNGVNRIVWIRATADAVEAAAEVWDNAFTKKLTTVSPGLDPNRNYILRACGYLSKDAAKIAGAVRIRKENGGHAIIGAGAGTGGGTGALGGTFYWFDGIPCKGSDAFTAESHSIVVETTAPEIVLGFEELPSGSGIGPISGAVGGMPAGGSYGAGATTGAGAFSGIMNLFVK